MAAMCQQSRWRLVRFNPGTVISAGNNWTSRRFYPPESRCGRNAPQCSGFCWHLIEFKSLKCFPNASMSQNRQEPRPGLCFYIFVYLSLKYFYANPSSCIFFIFPISHLKFRMTDIFQDGRPFKTFYNQFIP